ncbi:MAG TPA: hypothetical protein VJB87_05760 [Candidatus Nanoarchaeia archaeon]|nr:hypothetical protein [Candidatus Nanoarchaeia archaeon]
MNNKIFLSLSLVFLLGLAIFVSARQYSRELELPGYGTIGEYGEYVTAEDAELSVGWNLFLGLANPDWLITKDERELGKENFDSNNIKAIYGFNPATQEYIRFYPEPETDKLNNQDTRISTMIRTSAFWVYSGKEGKISYATLRPTTLNERNLFKGWNFVGITPDFTDKNLQEIKGDCEIAKVVVWLPERQEWDSKSGFSNLHFDKSLVKSGVLIKVTDDCKLGGSGDVIAPPTIPGTGDTSGQQEIKSITGQKENYSPKESIKLIVSGVDPNGASASSDKGWNIQYYTYNKNGGDFLQEYVPSGNYNANYNSNKGYWEIDYWAPSQPGEYYTEIDLYCGTGGSECYTTYGNEYSSKQKISFKVD